MHTGKSHERNNKWKIIYKMFHRIMEPKVELLILALREEVRIQDQKKIVESS